MKAKTMGKGLWIGLASVLIALACVMGMAQYRPAAADETETTVGIRYNPDEFTATEDYSAFVDAALYGGSYYDAIKGQVFLLDSERKEMKMQLDYGKSGLLLTSTGTGKAVEGQSFSVANKQYGDFNLDFRVFSQETYQGAWSVGAKRGEVDGTDRQKGTLLDSRWNPYLDVRTVGIKITSATDASKAFTVYVHGARDWNAAATDARVYIEGETYRDQGRKGYGLKDGKSAPENNGDGTLLQGTTFSNVSDQPESFAHSIVFDAESMSVYGKSYSLSSYSGSNGYKYTEELRLIRNVGSNSTTADGTGTVVSADGLKTLESADFADGYYVEVTIESMTDDNTPLTKAVKSSTTTTSSVYDDKTDDSTVVQNVYDRTAKIILYNLNGMDFRRYEGFDVQAKTFEFATASNVPTSGITATGLRLTSKAKNTAAEGNSFEFNGADFTENGVFSMALGAMTTQYADTNGNEANPWSNGPAAYDRFGLGAKMLDYDPYSDVRELSLMFRSKTDTDKAFTVYFSSRETKRKAMSVRVGIEGEAYRNNSGLKGFGYTENKFNNNSLWTASGGTFGMGNVTDTSPYYNNTNQPYVPIEFDPTEMKVYTSSYGKKLVRDLSANSGVDNATVKADLLTLSADDFAGGFTVTLTVERMNNDWNCGLKKFYSYNEGKYTEIDSGYTAASDGVHILEAGYNRPAIIDVFKITGDKTLTEGDVTVSRKDAFYVEPATYLDLGVAQKEISYAADVTLTPRLVSVVSEQSVTGTLAFAHESGEHTGTIALDVGGGGMFTPRYLGIYTFTTGAYAQTLRVVDDVPPEIGLTGEPLTVVSVGAQVPPVAESDVTATDAWSDVTIAIHGTYNGRPTAVADTVFDKTGLYEFTYTATDASGNSATVTRQVAVVAADGSAPRIYWDGPTQILVGADLDLSTIRAFDETDGAVTVTIQQILLYVGGTQRELTAENGVVCTAETGELYIYVTAVDAAGNTAERTYRVEVLEELRDTLDGMDDRPADEPSVKGCGGAATTSGTMAAGVLLGLATVGILRRRCVR